MKLRYRILAGLAAVLAMAVASFAFMLGYTKDCEPAPPVAEGVETMHAVRHRCYGSADVLEIGEVAKPVPADNEVLVRVHAAAVNPLDWHYMRGSPYFMRLDSGIGKPRDPGLGVDFAGTVETVGRNVTRFHPGDAVFGGRYGAFAEYVAIAEDRALTHKPDNVSFAQAAAVPVAAVTALQAVRDEGQVRPGQQVLINGASGGVGTFAVQIASSLGARVAGVCSTRNIELVKSLGADQVIDYTQQDYTQLEDRYDVIIDMVGNHTLSANRNVLRPGGRLVIVGGPKGDWLGPLVRPLGAMLMSPFVDEEMGMMLARLSQDDLAVIAGLMRDGKVTPVLDRSFSLREVPDAIRYSESGRARGKIIIDFETRD